jgi:NAD+ diphosphatase
MENYNVFAGAFVDRSGERRKDPDWLAQAVSSADSCFVPVWGEQCLVGGDPQHAVLLQRSQVEAFVDDQELIFLGLFRDQPAFAFAIDGSIPAPFEDFGEFHDLRHLGTVLPADEANLVAHARALVLWHASQVFCGLCRSAARPQAGIVLVASGDRCLLGRQANWPEGRYSTIAGFVEPGESLEDAVRREVYEETNVRVGAVHYHSSQPWPFPSSLMLGFLAEATSTDIALNDGELDDARWFTREELLGSDLPKLPFRISISRRLVDDWIDLGKP